MFWLFYLISIVIVWICLALYADKKRVLFTPKRLIGSIGLSILWPFFATGTLIGHGLIFMDELKL